MKKIGRRPFLKGGAAAGGAAILGCLTGGSALGASETSDGRDDVAVLQDLTRCVGCRRCEAACNRANDLPAPATPFEDPGVFAETRRPDDDKYTVVNRYEDRTWTKPVYRKVQCNHCAEPACASACPVGALQKTAEGPVIYDEDLCIGCRYCMVACPFSIPAFEYDDPLNPAIRKCTMCYHRIAAGQEPACVEACPVEAITFGPRTEMIKNARARIVGAPDRYVDHIYGEHEVGGTDWLYLSGVPFDEVGFPSVRSEPYPDLTSGFLSAVPLVLVGWPALFGGVYAMSRRRDEAATVEPADRERSEAAR